MWRIDLVVLSNQSRLHRSSDKGKSKSLNEVFEDFWMSNVEVTLFKKSKLICGDLVYPEKQTNPQGSVRTTSAVDLEEFCEKHYEKLLPFMADKYEYEQRKKEKLEELKVRLDFGDARKKSTRAQESAYSESRTISPRRQRRSRSPRHNPSVFTRLRRERSRSPRHEYKSKERRGSTMFKRLKSRGRSTSAHSDSHQESSRYTENHSESEDSEEGHWKSKLRRKKSSVEDDDLSQPWQRFAIGLNTRKRHNSYSVAESKGRLRLAKVLAVCLYSLRFVSKHNVAFCPRSITAICLLKQIAFCRYTSVLSYNDLKIRGGFERAFVALFDQDIQTFTGSTLLILDQLEKKLDKEEFQEIRSMDDFRFFLAYTRTEVRKFRDTLIQHMESVKKSIDERAHLKKDTSSRSGNDADIEDADIRPVNDQVPFTEVQLTAPYNVLTNEQHHSMQSKPIYDTHLLEKVDRNTTPDSTNMCHRGGEIDQNAKKCQVSCPLLDPSFDNMTTEFSNQSLESENISLKKTVAQLQKDFSRMEAHCVNMELKYQNQALKDGQHGQILNETSNKAKIKKEIEVLETINIELEHSVAKLLAENEKLHKENEHLKQTYKDLYDSIKKTRVQTKDHNDSLIAQINSKTVENADLKAQIQEKVFANVALKNELRKLKGNSVDTKFAKPSILGKPVLQPPRNQSVVRQPNAFKSERPNFSKPRFASQVDVNNVLSKPVTQHYLPKGRESAFAKPNHMIASSSSRNSSKNMPRFSSNDMVHNYYLEEAKKKTQERDRKSTTSVMPSAKSQNTTKSCKSKPRSNNQTSRVLPTSKSSCPTTTVMPKADHSRYIVFLPIILDFPLSAEKTNTPRTHLRWKPTVQFAFSLKRKDSGVCYAEDSDISETKGSQEFTMRNKDMAADYNSDNKTRAS
ncbi:hypothetical protein Tco_0800215 [Tanacetum coccineum]|uniref:Uncharacterized protein n=1 Tax=Tanacetum coccineum TaxID=301880 RepID=A0ABQ4ZVR7_9ASTR